MMNYILLLSSSKELHIMFLQSLGRVKMICGFVVQSQVQTTQHNITPVLPDSRISSGEIWSQSSFSTVLLPKIVLGMVQRGINRKAKGPLEVFLWSKAERK